MPQTAGEVSPASQRRGHVFAAQRSATESMVANCINQYLNTDYEARKTGDLNDLIDIFLFYYRHIHSQARVNQLTVIRNCGLTTDFPFLQENLTFFLNNVRTSMQTVYEREKEKFLNLTKY